MQRGRIITENKTNYRIFSEGKEYLANVRGNFFTEKTFPKVGDYVTFSMADDDKATIEEILPRTSVISRRDPETHKTQIIVTNVDRIFIVMGLDGDFNLSRIERYLQLAKQSHTAAAIVLNKVDQVDNVSTYLEAVSKIAGHTPIHFVSAKTGANMTVLLEYLKKKQTIVLLGSSGAGKSTITNWLLDDKKQETQDVRSDDSRGKHTTTARQLFTLPNGGYLIDTPGMRELGMISEESDEQTTAFSAIDELANECQFSNCDHVKSKGCAVLAAVEEGKITARQLANYLKLKNEPAKKEQTRDRKRVASPKKKR